MLVVKPNFIFILLTSLATRCIVAQQFLDETLLYEGEIREYRIYIPASYDGSTSFPLMFNFHGGGGVIAGQVAIADMRPLADTANFIVVYPQAFPDPNDGGSNNWLHKDPSTIDDVFFVDEMINTISSQYKIDAERIYACGYSLGGEFCFELACRLNDKIAAVGVPSDGSTVERHSWEGGDGCVMVDNLKVLGGGHDWPGSFGNLDIDATLEIWNYVSRFNLEGLIECNITSVEEPNIEAAIVYPNPTYDEVKIEMLENFDVDRRSNKQLN